MAKKTQNKPTPVTGDAFAVPLEGGRFAVCRVLKVREDALLVANADWIGRAVPDAQNPALRSILRVATITVPRFDTIGLDGRMLLFTLGVSLLTGLVFGILPAMRAKKVDMRTAMQGASAKATSGAGHRRALQSIVVAEMALSIYAVNNGYMDKVERNKVVAFEAAMQAFAKSNHAASIKAINDKPVLKEHEATLKKSCEDFVATGAY